MKNKHRTCENCQFMWKAPGKHCAKTNKRRKAYFICEFDDSRMDDASGRCKHWKGKPYNRSSAKHNVKDAIDEMEEEHAQDIEELESFERLFNDDYPAMDEWYD